MYDVKLKAFAQEMVVDAVSTDTGWMTVSQDCLSTAPTAATAVTVAATSYRVLSIIVTKCKWNDKCKLFKRIVRLNYSKTFVLEKLKPIQPFPYRNKLQCCGWSS